MATRLTSIPRTTHWLPKARAPASMRPGFFTASELTLTFSAPARMTARISSTLRMPPPTEKGMKIVSATRRTTSSMMLRASDEAVMS